MGERNPRNIIMTRKRFIYRYKSNEAFSLIVHD